MGMSATDFARRGDRIPPPQSAPFAQQATARTRNHAGRPWPAGPWTDRFATARPTFSASPTPPTRPPSANGSPPSPTIRQSARAPKSRPKSLTAPACCATLTAKPSSARRHLVSHPPALRVPRLPGESSRRLAGTPTHRRRKQRSFACARPFHSSRHRQRSLLRSLPTPSTVWSSGALISISRDHSLSPRPPTWLSTASSAPICSPGNSMIVTHAGSQRRRRLRHGPRSGVSRRAPPRHLRRTAQPPPAAVRPVRQPQLPRRLSMEHSASTP